MELIFKKLNKIRNIFKNRSLYLRKNRTIKIKAKENKTLQVIRFLIDNEKIIENERMLLSCKKR